MSSPCLICDGVTNLVAIDIDGGETENGREALVKFFRFLERHLEGDGVDKEGEGARKREGLSFDKILAADKVAVLACDYCLQIVESFSQLYDQMKSVEVRLNWKLETLKNLMSCKGQKDSRMEGVSGSVQQLGEKTGRRLKGGHGNEGMPNVFVDFKKKVVKKCKEKLKASFPKLVLTEVIVSPGTDSKVTIDVDQDAVPIIPVGNLENELSLSVSVDHEGHTQIPSPFSQISERTEISEKTFSKVVLTENNNSSGAGRNEKETINQAKVVCRTPITNLETELAITSRAKDGYTPVLDTSASPDSGAPKSSMNRSIDFKDNLVKKCTEQSERGFPKVVLIRLPSPPDENSTSNPDVASTNSRITVTNLDLELSTASSYQDQEGYTRTPSPILDRIKISELSECDRDPTESESEVPMEEDEVFIESVSPEFLIALHGNYEENIPMDWEDDDNVSADLPDIFPLEVQLEFDEDLESSTNIEDTELPTRPSITLPTEAHGGSHKNEGKERTIAYPKKKVKAAALSGSESDDSEYSTESESESESEDSEYGADKKEEMKERAKQNQLKYQARAKQNQLKYQAIRAQKRANRLGLGAGIPCKVPGCPERLFTPQSKEESEDHAKLHGNFPCSFCDFVHDYAPDLAWHEFLKHSKDSSGKESDENIVRSCPRRHCRYNNKYKYKCIRHHLTSHLKLVANGPPNTCTICKLVLNSGTDGILKLHYFGHHDLTKMDNPNDAYKCDQKDCPAYFLKKRQLQIHKRRLHTFQAQLTCGIEGCELSFTTRQALKSHKKQRHGICTGAHRCTFPECNNRGFESEKYLAQHYRIVHKKLKLDEKEDSKDPLKTKLVKIPCTVPDCPERLFTPRSTKEAKIHSKLHGNFPCSFCDLVHNYAPDLAWHEFAKHSKDSSEDNRPLDGSWSCPRPTCPYQNGNKSECIKHHLISHMNLIPNGRVNTCNICKFVVLSKRQVNKKLEHHHRTNHALNSEDNQNTAHKCDQEDCPAYFLTARKLQIHKLKNHSIQASLICNIGGCKRSFTSITGLQFHKRQKHGVNGDHRCTFPGCDRAFENKHNLEVHITIVHKKTKITIKCPKCDRSYQSQAALKFHMKTHSLHPTSPKPLMSIRPGKTFTTKTALEPSHSAPESSTFSSFSCEICSKKFKTQQKLDNHIQSMHTKNSTEFLCRICGKEFVYRIALKSHMNKRHPDQKKDEDQKNGLSDTESDVSEHSTKLEQNKTDEKNGKPTKNRPTKAINKSTRRTDSTNPKPSKQFLCKLCGKTFTTKRSLERHQRSHSTSEIKKRQTQQKLDSYIKSTHTKNSAQFHCEICGKGFIYRLALRTHMIKIHPDQTEDEDAE